MVTELDDEIRRMEELEQEENQVFQTAVSLDDSISTLEVDHPITVSRGATIREVAKKVQERSLGCVLVVNKKHELVGIFTERDMLLKITGKGLDFDKEIVDDYMTKNPETLTMADPVAFLFNKMYVGGFRNVPIVDERRRPVGLISFKDVIHLIATHFASEILNLPHHPSQHVANRPEGG